MKNYYAIIVFTTSWSGRVYDQNGALFKLERVYKQNDKSVYTYVATQVLIEDHALKNKFIEFKDGQIIDSYLGEIPLNYSKEIVEEIGKKNFKNLPSPEFFEAENDDVAKLYYKTRNI